MKPRACFFSTAPIEQISREQYSLADIRILRELGFDVLVANRLSAIPRDCDLYFSWWASGSILPMLVAKLVGKPNVVVAGGNEALRYRDSVTGQALGYLDMPFYKRLATRLALRWSSVVTVVSSYMVKDVSGLAGRDVVVVPNCVDTDYFSPDESQEKSYVTTCFRIDEGPTRVKRGENLVRAARQVLRQFPGQIFVVIGYKGDAYAKLRALAHDLGIADSFIFTGAIQNAAVRDWLVKSKCYVQISDTETFGVAVAEAMSVGVPVIVSSRGALPELVGAGGTYVDHNSIDSIALGIVDVISKTNEARVEIGASLRRRVQERYRFDLRKRAIGDIVTGLVGSG